MRQTRWRLTKLFEDTCKFTTWATVVTIRFRAKKYTVLSANRQKWTPIFLDDIYIHCQPQHLPYYRHDCASLAIEHSPLQRQERGTFCRWKWRHHKHCHHSNVNWKLICSIISGLIVCQYTARHAHDRLSQQQLSFLFLSLLLISF